MARWHFLPTDRREPTLCSFGDLSRWTTARADKPLFRNITVALFAFDDHMKIEIPERIRGCQFLVLSSWGFISNFISRRCWNIAKRASVLIKTKTGTEKNSSWDLGQRWFLNPLQAVSNGSWRTWCLHVATSNYTVGITPLSQPPT
jgi:hypothetical protein